MGLLDRFRGGGKDDKEKELEENIAKIREKIQGQGGGGGDLSRPPAPQREGGQDRPPRPPAAEDEGEQREDQASGQLGRSRPPRQPPQPEQQEAQPGDDRVRPGAAGRGQRPERGPDRGRRTAGQERPASRDQGPAGAGERQESRSATGQTGATDTGAPTDTDLPEPPEVKELDVSEVEGGSLYVTVDTFRDTLQTVADLRQLAHDLDGHVGSMEGTLDEDQETAHGVQQLLDSADDRIEEMRDLMTE